MPHDVDPPVQCLPQMEGGVLRRLVCTDDITQTVPAGSNDWPQLSPVLFRLGTEAPYGESRGDFAVQRSKAVERQCGGEYEAAVGLRQLALQPGAS